LFRQQQQQQQQQQQPQQLVNSTTLSCASCLRLPFSLLSRPKRNLMISVAFFSLV